MTFIDQSVGTNAIVRYALRSPRSLPRDIMLFPVTSFLTSVAERKGPTSSGLVIAFSALATAGAVIYRAWSEEYQSPDDISRQIGTGARRLGTKVRTKVDEEVRMHQDLFAKRPPRPAKLY